MKKAYFVSFIGIDGTGKTTLAQMAAEEMSKKGLKGKYVRGRFETFGLLEPFIFGVRKVILFGRKTDNSPEGIATKNRLFQNQLLARAWEFSVLFVYLFQILAKISIPLMLGRSLSCDRYVHDTVVDLAVDLNYPDQRMYNLLNRILFLVPKPNVVFLLELPEEEAYERNLPKMDGLSFEYLSKRRKRYLKLVQRPEIIVLDGSRTLAEIRAEIMRELSLLKEGDED